jgi:hypothetical protein
MSEVLCALQQLKIMLIFANDSVSMRKLAAGSPYAARALSRSRLCRSAAIASRSLRRCPTMPTPKSFRSSAVKFGRTVSSISPILANATRVCDAKIWQPVDPRVFVLPTERPSRPPRPTCSERIDPGFSPPSERKISITRDQSVALPSIAHEDDPSRRVTRTAHRTVASSDNLIGQKNPTDGRKRLCNRDKAVAAC